MQGMGEMELASCQRCGRRVPASTILYIANALPVCATCCLRADLAAMRRARGGGSVVGAIGAIACVVPLLLRVLDLGGAPDDLTSLSYRAWVAVGCGSVAVGCGLTAAATARARASWLWLAISVAIIVIGAYHAGRGTGALW